MHYLITVIVPVYNVEKYLEKCICSIISQTFTNWKLILVDDGSPDNCPSICDHYASIDDRIFVIHKKNGGLSSARNAALDVLDTEYVTFVDSDDYLHPECLADCMEIMNQHNSDIVQFRYVKGNDNDFFENNKIQKSSVTDFIKHEIFGSKFDKVGVWGKLYKSILWNDVRMPVGRLNEDDATTWKLYYRANKISAIDTPYYYYRVNQNSIMASLKKEPNIDYPIMAYHERIAFFDANGEDELSKLSKWRYTKYLMLTIGDKRYSKDQRTRLRKEFQNIYASVLSCGRVPLSHKVLVVMTKISPIITYKFISLIRHK